MDGCVSAKKFIWMWDDLHGDPPLLPELLPLQSALLQLNKRWSYSKPAQCCQVHLASAPCWPGETWQHRSDFNAINRLRASDLFSTLQQKYRAVTINSTITSRTTAVTVGAAGSVGTDKKQSSQFHESSLINRWFHSVPVMPAHYTEPETFYWPLIGLCSLNEWKIKERNIPLYKCAYVYIKIISENRLLRDIHHSRKKKLLRVWKFLFSSGNDKAFFLLSKEPDPKKTMNCKTHNPTTPAKV